MHPPGLYSGGIYESYGRGRLVQPEPEKDHALRMGDWNEMKIRVVGSRVTTWLNGTEMIDLMDEKIGEATGHIALQIHDGGGSRYGGGTCGWWSTKACGEHFGEWSRTRPTFKDLRVSAFSGIAMGDHEDGFRPPSPLHRQPSLKKASAKVLC